MSIILSNVYLISKNLVNFIESITFDRVDFIFDKFGISLKNYRI